MLTPDQIAEIQERADRASPLTPITCVERVGFDDGKFNYEINDYYHLVSFSESNHHEPMRAKFNAEFYVKSREDIPRLLEDRKELMERLRVAEKIIIHSLHARECNAPYGQTEKYPSMSAYRRALEIIRGEE